MSASSYSGRFSVVMFILATTLLSACGARVGGLCDESVDCGVIEPDDESECRSDLHNALESGDLEKNDVDKCLACMRDNDCGPDTFVDCNDQCAAVALYVIFSRVN